MNQGPVLIWKAGPDKLRNYFNKSWLAFTGRSVEAELGNGWAQRVHPDDLSICLKTHTQAFENHNPVQMEYRLRRHDGQYRWMLEIGVPRFSPDGTLEQYLGSCIDITERKLTEEALLTVSRRLIEAQEQERAWIARELHDDICQQVALLAIELDHPKHLSEVDLQAYIGGVRKRVLEIGNDIQALSHRLHSSKLEYMGLVVASKSFCHELAEQKSVEIDFASEAIPEDLPREVSVCLFRILQEALNNAVRHSGVRHFQVKLLGNCRDIQLSVCDTGMGFIMEQAIAKQGLGLVSMRERVALARGTISILSNPTHGTEINVRVPIPEVAKAQTGDGGTA